MRFLPDFSRKADRVNYLLSKAAPMNFDRDERQQVFVDELKNNLISPLVVALPQEGMPFVMDTYASPTIQKLDMCS